MRCYQSYGLSPSAEKFLEDNAKKTDVKTCGSCGHKTGGRLIEEIYDRENVFNQDVSRIEYTLKDGSKVREVVQLCPWSSGPMEFLCLEGEDGNKFCKWTKEEVFDACEEDVFYEENEEDVETQV